MDIEGLNQFVSSVKFSSHVRKQPNEHVKVTAKSSKKKREEKNGKESEKEKEKEKFEFELEMKEPNDSQIEKDHIPSPKRMKEWKPKKRKLYNEHIFYFDIIWWACSFVQLNYHPSQPIAYYSVTPFMHVVTAARISL